MVLTTDQQIIVYHRRFNDRCDAKRAVTVPAAGHHRPLTGTKLYRLVAEAHVCEQLAQGCYLKMQGRESNPRPFESQVQRPNHRERKCADTIGTMLVPWAGHFQC